MMMEDEAKRAIMDLNGCMLNGNRLNVEVPNHHVYGIFIKCGFSSALYAGLPTSFSTEPGELEKSAYSNVV